jgi:hypothetical protein
MLVRTRGLSLSGGVGRVILRCAQNNKGRGGAASEGSSGRSESVDGGAFAIALCPPIDNNCR